MENWDPKSRNQFKKKVRVVRLGGDVHSSYTKQLIANRETKTKEQEVEIFLLHF